MSGQWIAVALGGALGAVGRWIVALGAARWFGAGWPWGTLFANWLGSLLIGFLFGVGVERAGLTPAWRLFLLTGFLGAFTTFSTFALETVQLAREDRLGALGNLVAHNLGGLILAAMGLWLAEVLGR